MRIPWRETERLLRKSGIPHVAQILAREREEAVSAAKQIGFPVVLKISSPQIIHKTEAHGVVLNVENEKRVRCVFETLVKRAKKMNAVVDGVAVQEQCAGRQVIIGAKQDSTFGPVLMFGLGGIFVEVLKDVSFRLIPLKRNDAREMIREIRGYPLLAGVRGERPVNFRKLEDMLLHTSQMLRKNPRITELDMNPVFATEKRVIAADVRILI